MAGSTRTSRRGHLRDPYHRVDVRRSSAHVVVRLGDRVLADSCRPMVVSETGLPNRWYPADIAAALTSSTTRSHCPHKGDATYRNLPGRADVARSYEEPLDGAARAAGYRCFSADDLTIEVDGQPV